MAGRGGKGLLRPRREFRSRSRKRVAGSSAIRRRRRVTTRAEECRSDHRGGARLSQRILRLGRDPGEDALVGCDELDPVVLRVGHEERVDAEIERVAAVGHGADLVFEARHARLLGRDADAVSRKLMASGATRFTIRREAGAPGGEGRRCANPEFLPARGDTVSVSERDRRAGLIYTNANSTRDGHSSAG